MAKIIAVIGSPGSGKTTVTLKLAQELYCATTSGAVIYLSPSLKVPALGVLFPNYTPDSIFSLGTMFDKTDIYEAITSLAVFALSVTLFSVAKSPLNISAVANFPTTDFLSLITFSGSAEFEIFTISTSVSLISVP